MGAALHDRTNWDQLEDLARTVGADAAAQMWGRTDLTPADVDIAELYDGFSYITMLWLEALAAVRLRRERAVRRGRDTHRPRRVAPPQHHRAASSPPDGSTATASSTRRASSSGARGASARWPADPRWQSWPPGAAIPAGACSSPRWHDRDPERSTKTI